jgi:uncharacterized protein (DUF2141 family)
MKIKLGLSAVLLGFLIVLISFTTKNTGELSLKIDQINPIEGAIRILIFKGKDGWPNDHTKAVYTKSIFVKKSVIHLEIKELLYGKYAIAILHDVNLNKKADKSIIGIPSEPFGFSNYPKITFGVPNFEDVSFSIDSPNNHMVISMKEI